MSFKLRRRLLTNTAFLISLYFSSFHYYPAFSQNAFICNYNGEITSSEVVNGTFQVNSSDTINKKAQAIVSKILLLMDLDRSTDFIVQQVSTVNNACAIIKNGKRYILFNSSFIDYVDTATNSSFAKACILAHEIAHHILGHTVATNVTERHRLELAADYWSGIVAYRLEASLGDAQSAVEIYGNQNATRSHPARHDRLNEIQRAYLFAKQKYPKTKKPEAYNKVIYPTFTNKGFWKPSSTNFRQLKKLKLLQFEIYGVESAYEKSFPAYRAKPNQPPKPFYQLDIYYNKSSNPLIDESTDKRRKPIFNVVLENTSDKNIVITKIVYRVHNTEQVAGGNAGIINPAAKYQHTLEFRTGDQEFAVIPAFEIGANSVGSFLLELSTNFPDAGLIWDMTVYFLTGIRNEGTSSDRFELLMTGPIKN